MAPEVATTAVTVTELLQRYRWANRQIINATPRLPSTLKPHWTLRDQTASRQNTDPPLPLSLHPSIHLLLSPSLSIQLILLSLFLSSISLSHFFSFSSSHSLSLIFFSSSFLLILPCHSFSFKIFNALSVLYLSISVTPSLSLSLSLSHSFSPLSSSSSAQLLLCFWQLQLTIMGGRASFFVKAAHMGAEVPYAITEYFWLFPPFV